MTLNPIEKVKMAVLVVKHCLRNHQKVVNKAALLLQFPFHLLCTRRTRTSMGGHELADGCQTFQQQARVNMRSLCKHLHEVNIISLLLHSLVILITVLQLQVREMCHPGWRAILCCWLPAVAEWYGWGTRGRRIHVCKTCHRYLRGKKLPYAAVCNDMDFGNLAPGMLHIILRLSLFTFPVIIHTHHLLLLISLQKWNARPTSWRILLPVTWQHS